MVEVNESTPLLKSEILIERSPPKSYQTQSKKFHTCALVSIVALVALAAGATLGFFLGSRKANAELKVEYANSTGFYQLLNRDWPLPDTVVPNISYTPALSSIVTLAVEEGKSELQNKDTIENDTQTISTESPSYKHQKSVAYSDLADQIAKLGYVENEASKYLRSKNYSTVITYENAKDLKWASETNCTILSEPISCNVTKYRTVTGFCNNLKHPHTWGVAMTPFRRALPPVYDDGVSVPRGGFKTDLPSARNVSTQIHRPVYRSDTNFTVMLAVWGQFIDHDITATASSRGANGSTISCCSSNGTLHPECFPVLLDENDEYYSQHNLTCMEFVRSAPALRCSFGAREQINQASSYLDGSMIYGNQEDLSKRLRSFQNGQLEMSYTKDNRSLLPISKDVDDGCNQVEEIKNGRYCFLSGDTRANENSHLTSMHLIFARHHNRIAAELSTLNPQWTDETLYQEARRIVVAQIQHITYNEFLPNILGSQVMEKLKLNSSSEGYSRYRPDVDASISNNFATSSFRFAHTLIPRLMKVLANDTGSPEYVETHKMLFNPFSLHDGDLDSIIRGALNTSVEKADNYFNKELTEHLFENANQTNTTKKFTYGLDLVALNIQRGRDHGLPSYPRWREYCGLGNITNFRELDKIFDKESLKTIATIYKSVDEIDLYTGSLSEKPIEGGLVGPTLTCLISDQFVRIKYGDRYWYETDELPQAFTKDQLVEIRKTTLAGIICQNADNLDTATPYVMRSSNATNKPVRCSEIPQPNLTKFRVPISNETETSSPVSKPGTNISEWLYKLSELNNERNAYPNAVNISRLLAKKPEFNVLKLEPNSTTKLIDSALAKELLNMFSDVFHSSPLTEAEIEILDLEHTYNVTLLVLSSSVPLNATANREKTFIWKWSPETNTISGTYYTGNVVDTFSITYKRIRGTLRTDCVYYSKITNKIDFNLNVDTEASGCTVIAPIIPGNGSITIVIRKPNHELKKENELSFEKNEIRTKFDQVSGSMVIAIDGINKLVWNGTYPVEFDTKLYWYADNTTIAYPISWSGFYIDNSFVGSFLLPEKVNDTIVWHEGEFTINLGNDTEIIKACQVYTAILFLSTKEDINLDVSELQKQTEWDLNEYVRVILIGDLNNGKFTWNGELVIVTPKVTEELDTISTYRPYVRYAGKVISGTLYAELNGPKYLWWTGNLPSTVLIPAEMPVNITHIFDQAVIWTPTEQNGTFGRALFATTGEQSKVFLSGNFDYQITSLLNSPSLQQNAKYYSPIILQQKANGFGDEILQKLSANNKNAIFAPVTLLGVYLKQEHVFAWNGKFIISLADN